MSTYLRVARAIFSVMMMMMNWDFDSGCILLFLGFNLTKLQNSHFISFHFIQDFIFLWHTDSSCFWHGMAWYWIANEHERKSIRWKDKIIYFHSCPFISSAFLQRQQQQTWTNEHLHCEQIQQAHVFYETSMVLRISTIYLCTLHTVHCDEKS